MLPLIRSSPHLVAGRTEKFSSLCTYHTSWLTPNPSPDRCRCLTEACTRANHASNQTSSLAFTLLLYTSNTSSPNHDAWNEGGPACMACLACQSCAGTNAAGVLRSERAGRRHVTLLPSVLSAPASCPAPCCQAAPLPPRRICAAA